MNCEEDKTKTRESLLKPNIQSLVDTPPQDRIDTEEKENATKPLNHLSEAHTTYGIVLHGYLKTRFIETNCQKSSFFTFQSSWKLRYWRLILTTEGLLLEKSRSADTRPYKRILLPFGKTSVWENWGKRGDSKYSFGFTLRVTCLNLQLEAAVETEKIRRRWMNVLQKAFCAVVEDTLELVNHLAQKASDHLSKMTNAGDEHCAVRPRMDKKNNVPKHNAATSMNDYEWQCFHQRVDDELIPRRYSADVYDSQGHIHNTCAAVRETCPRPLCHKSTSLDVTKESTSKWEERQQMATAMFPFDHQKHLRVNNTPTCPSPVVDDNSSNASDEVKSLSSASNRVMSENNPFTTEGNPN